MTTRYLEYQPVNGYIQNWLVAGPHLLPPAEAFAFPPELLPEGEPVDREKFTLNGAPLAWKYTRTLDDHLVDASLLVEGRQSAAAAAAASLLPDQPGPAELTLTSFGPAELWVNGALVAQLEGGENTFLQPQTVRAAVELVAANRVVVRFGQTGSRALALAFALRVDGLAGGLAVRLATKARYPRRHYLFERAFELACLENVAVYRGAHFNLRFTQAFDNELTYAYHVLDKDSMIYVEGSGAVDPEQVNDVGHTVRLYERPYWVTLRAPGREYWEQDLRYEMRLPVYVLDNKFSEEPAGSFFTRRDEGVAAAAALEGPVFGQLARMAQDKWDKVDEAALNAALAQLGGELPPAAGPLEDLLGLAVLAARYPQQETLGAGFKAALQAGLSAFPYAQAAQGASHSEALVLLAAELLAGQAYPQARFGGRSGQEAAAQAAQAAAAWITAAGQLGFAEWDTPAAYERIVAALAQITTLAQDETLRDLAAVLLDKVLFLLAVNAYKGGLGGAHACAQAADLRTTQLQATAGILRMLWGVGVNTRQAAAVVSLATADYEFPSFFYDIAHAREPLWSRERHAAGGREVNKALYRTPDFLLSSAQDERPGQPDVCALPWQAVLGPNAVVFTSAPAVYGSEPAHRPGFWLGNTALPRVAQWKDALIAAYQLPEDGWLDFTHAYFPIYEFDEYFFEGGWAFGRKGAGYVALAASSGFDLVARVPDGHRELRASGRQTTWVCLMGRVETDGSFVQFHDKVLALPLEWQPGGARLTTLRGDALAFGWTGDFTVNGQAQPLAGFAHIDNPYCQAALPAKTIDITHGDTVMQLNFE